MLREQGRGITGALMVLGLTLLYTVETWHLAWRLPMGLLVAYAVVGLAGVSAVTDAVGFQDEGNRSLRRRVVEFAEIVLQSFLAAYVTPFAMGVTDLGDAPITVVRLGLIELVPLGFGAAANRLLTETDGKGGGRSFTGGQGGCHGA